MATFVDCPQSDRAHWKFRLLGAPVAVTFSFWITTLIFGSDRDLIGALIWVAVCFVSILLHEMGHVLAFRFYGRRAEVVLYGFGGMAIPNHGLNETLPAVIVALAGPFAGFCLAALTCTAVLLTGGHIFSSYYLLIPHLYAALSTQLLTETHGDPWFFQASRLVNDLLFVNFYWGLVNLLPIWPLDGGRVSRALLTQWDSSDGCRKSLIVSILFAAAISIASLTEHNVWLAVMFGILAISSVQAFETERRRPVPAYRR